MSASKSLRSLSSALSRWIRPACFVIVLPYGMALAQSTTGAASGTITDLSGGSVSNAQVKAVNVDTHETHTATSNQSGNYIFPALVPGRYEVLCTSGGFSSQRQTGIVVNVNESAHVSFVLTPGAVEQSVTISAATAEIDATDSQLGQVIDQKKIEDLPVNGRSAYGLALLSPGVEEYNLNVEQQLAKHWQAQFAYVGSATRKAYVVRDANAPIYSPGASITTAGLNARRPYQPIPSRYRFAGIYEIAPSGSGSYNALQVTLSRLFRNNFSILANYTWQKSIDVVSADVASISGSQLVDDTDPARDRGISNNNVPQIFVAAASYAIPHFPQFGLIGRNVVGGWQLNTIVQLRSGPPVNVISGVDSNLNGTNNDRPNLIGNPALSRGRSRDEKIATYFNTAAFAQLPAGTPYGNVARNSLIGPGYSNVDLSLFKNIAIWREHSLQIRGEFFNVFNHVNLGNPVATMTSSQFGRITSAGSPRIIQLAARYSF